MTSTQQEATNWTTPGAQEAAKNTYASVKKALEPVTDSLSIEVFLQGSYANSTNIRGDSDVDIVVMSKKVFYGKTEVLSTAALARFRALGDGTYTSDQLRTDVTNALVRYYGSQRVHPHNKCIRIDKTDGYVDADVVPSFQVRRYTKPDANLYTDYVEGIQIRPLHGSSIVNYPKVHKKNGERKNEATGGHYKKTVRQMKHLRSRAVAEGRLTRDDAPGYLLECMTFNVPNDLFVASDRERLLKVGAWLNAAQKVSFWSCDLVHHIFADDPGGFTTSQGDRIASALWEAL